MEVTMNEDTQKAEKPVKNTVAVRLDEVPMPIHEKVKRFRKEMIKRKGRMVTLTEAYYEYLRTR
jgi:hypothetical protein